MASQKAIDNANRLKYVRALERFHKSVVGYLSSGSDVTLDSYKKKIQNSLKLLERVQEAQLYKGDLQDLQKLVKKIIAFCDSDDIENIKSEILYASNQLDKTKNSRRYKKEKYSQSNYDDWE